MHLSSLPNARTQVLGARVRVDGKLTEKSDMFSFGVVLLELTWGQPVTSLCSRLRPLHPTAAWSCRNLLQVRDDQRHLHQPAPFPTWSRGLLDLMEARPVACALHCQRRVTRRRAVVEPSSRQLRCLLPILPTPSFRVAKKCPTPAFLVAKKCTTPAFLVAKKCSFPVVLTSTRPSHGDLHGTCFTTTRCHHLLGHPQHVIIPSSDGIRCRRHLGADL